MKNAIFLLIFVFFGTTLTEAWAECPGTEWSLGRAIQVAPTFSTNPKWPKWKAKLGVCRGGDVSFIQDAYFQHAAPTPEQLTAAFGEAVHAKPWHAVPEKQRTFYVFGADYEAEMSHRGAFVSSVILPLLLTEKREIGPGPTTYTPENPNGTAANDPALTLSEDAWQRTYPVGAIYCQVNVRLGGAKVKFGQRISDTIVRWFDIRYDIPVDPNWSAGLAPFDLSAIFPGYVFKNAQYPGDDQDIWTARVLIPGYKHPVYTPSSPNSSADGENDLILSEDSWQQHYPDGALYCQVDVRPEGAKVKFLQKFADRAIPYAVFREISVDSAWTLGQAPFNLLMAFPEYDFDLGFHPIGEETEWSARVYLW
jgi:hypothetical protein